MTLLHFHLQKQKFLSRLHEAEICVLFDQAKKSHKCGQVLSGQDLVKIFNLEHNSTDLTSDQKGVSGAWLQNNFNQLRGRLSLVFYTKFDFESLQDLQKMMHQKEYGHCLGLLAKTRLISDSSQVRFDFVSKQDLKSLNLRYGINFVDLSSVNYDFHQEILRTFQQSNSLIQTLSPVSKLTGSFTLGQVFLLSLFDSLANNGS